jgi:hypothetical protein
MVRKTTEHSTIFRGSLYRGKEGSLCRGMVGSPSRGISGSLSAYSPTRTVPPVTIPVAKPIVAVVVLLLVQKPPAVVSVNDADAPLQITFVPLIEPITAYELEFMQKIITKKEIKKESNFIKKYFEMSGDYQQSCYTK